MSNNFQDLFVIPNNLTLAVELFITDSMGATDLVAVRLYMSYLLHCNPSEGTLNHLT